MRTITCPGCEKKTEAPDGGSIGALVKATGWHPIMTHTGAFHYLCPGCYHVVHEYARKIIRVIGDDMLYFPSLLREEKDV